MTAVPAQTADVRRALPVPLAWTAGACWAGVLAGTALPGSGTVACALAAVVLVATFPLGPRLRSAGLMVVFFAVGVALLQVSLRRVPADDISRLVSAEPALVGLTVGPLESARPLGVRGRGLLAEADVIAIDLGTGDRPASGRVRLRFANAPDGVTDLPGLKVTGLLSRSDRAANPGQADDAWYDAIAGIGAELQIPAAAVITALPGDTLSPGRALRAWREGAKSRLAAGFDPTSENALLLKALLLGDIDPALAPVREDFSRTGTTHHLAVSGTHIAVVGGFVFGLLRAAMLLPIVGSFITPRRALWATALVVIAYGTAVVPSPPVSRSVLLAVLVAVALSAGRRVSMPNILGACCLVLLAIDPRQALLPGFQLTFFVVWSLVTLGPALANFVQEYRDRDFLIADRWRPDTRAARLRRWGWKFASGGAVAVVCWLAAGPVVAHHFGQANPYAALASLLLAPAVFAAIVAGGLKVVLSVFLPFADPLWAWLAGAFARVLRESVGAAAAVPGSSLPLPPLPAWAALLALLLLTLPLWPAMTATRSRRKLAWSLAALATLATPFVPRLLVNPAPGITLTVLALGDARCLVITQPGHGALVIDAGSPTHASDPFRRAISPFLRQADIRQIDTLILTHPGLAHSGAVPSLLRGIPTARVLAHEDLLEGSDTPVQLAAADAGISLEPLAPGSVLRPGALTLDVLPTSGPSGLVLRLTVHGRTLLLPGTTDSAVLRDLLLTAPADLRADVALVPKLQTPSPTLADFLRATEAPYLILPDDDTPTVARRQFLRDHTGPPLLRTSDRGAVTLRITPDGTLTVTTFRP